MRDIATFKAHVLSTFIATVYAVAHTSAIPMSEQPCLPGLKDCSAEDFLDQSRALSVVAYAAVSNCCPEEGSMLLRLTYRLI